MYEYVPHSALRTLETGAMFVFVIFSYFGALLYTHFCFLIFVFSYIFPQSSICRCWCEQKVMLVMVMLSLSCYAVTNLVIAIMVKIIVLKCLFIRILACHHPKKSRYSLSFQITCTYTHPNEVR